MTRIFYGKCNPELEMRFLMEELYFCIHLTETEHNICSEELRQRCDETGAEFRYWRELKDGHVPMYREVKVVGSKYQINLIKQFVKDQKWDKYHIERNPYKI